MPVSVADHHCSTCGTEIDEPALAVMIRNRNARDAHFHELTADLGDSDATMRRLAVGVLVVTGISIVIWMTWISRSLPALEVAR